ncbi:MAG: UPF0280 family protein [Candidatus Lokiarchaeota archaeon]|nr:UPF0280 family protein [Candidatus Lokiarchaeota archaeon]
MKTYKLHFKEKESDVTIISESNSAIKKAKKSFFYQRNVLEKYAYKNKEFLTSFSPIKVESNEKIINIMAEAGYLCDVGPMASVAGAIADIMVEVMQKVNLENYVPARIALVENGGEIAINSVQPMKVGLYTGPNDLNFNIGFLIEEKDCPIGIGTSSATIGHAFSFGDADAVTIFAENATLADASATRVANVVKGNDIEKSINIGLDIAQDIVGIRGAIINRENKVGKVGKIPKLIKIEGNADYLLEQKKS